MYDLYEHRNAFYKQIPSRHMSPFQPCLHPERHEPLTWLQPLHAWWHCSEQSCPKNPCKQTGSTMKINLKSNLSFYIYSYKIPYVITNNTQLITFCSYGKVKWYNNFRIIVSYVHLLNIYLFITIAQFVLKERYTSFYLVLYPSVFVYTCILQRKHYGSYLCNSEEYRRLYLYLINNKKLCTKN